jgi:hypothetical protein
MVAKVGNLGSSAGVTPGAMGGAKPAIAKKPSGGPSKSASSGIGNGPPGRASPMQQQATEMRERTANFSSMPATADKPAVKAPAAGPQTTMAAAAHPAAQESTLQVVSDSKIPFDTQALIKAGKGFGAMFSKASKSSIEPGGRPVVSMPSPSMMTSSQSPRTGLSQLGSAFFQTQDGKPTTEQKQQINGLRHSTSKLFLEVGKVMPDFLSGNIIGGTKKLLSNPEARKAIEDTGKTAFELANSRQTEASKQNSQATQAGSQPLASAPSLNTTASAQGPKIGMSHLGAAVFQTQDGKTSPEQKQQIDALRQSTSAIFKKVGESAPGLIAAARTGNFDGVVKIGTKLAGDEKLQRAVLESGRNAYALAQSRQKEAGQQNTQATQAA